MRPPRPTGRRARNVVCMDSWLSSDLVREVVLERKLHLRAVALEAVGEVLATAPLKLAAEHHVWYRSAEQVAEKIVAAPVCVGRRVIGVVDVGHRVTECAGELRVPGVIDKCHQA